VFLQVGTGEHNKNICRVAEALRGISCELEIIGRVSERQRQVLERNSISYRSYSNLSDAEVIERYRQCDAVLAASTYEGFGMPIIEANAVGRPVVTSNVCAMPEVAGGAACLVDPFDCASIREGVLRILEDPGYRAGLVKEGFENVKRFHPVRIASEYAALYQEVVS
jgi:glycosyltransferase involved in cell wall biosynthesis